MSAYSLENGGHRVKLVFCVCLGYLVIFLVKHKVVPDVQNVAI